MCCQSQNYAMENEIPIMQFMSFSPSFVIHFFIIIIYLTSPTTMSTEIEC